MIQSELIVGLIGVVMTGLSSYISWILAKRKYDSEVDHNVIDNMKESLEFYEQLSNDNKERLIQALQENKKLREDLNSVLDENKSLRRDIEVLKDQMIKLTTSICYDLSCKMRMRQESLSKEEIENEENNIK